MYRELISDVSICIMFCFSCFLLQFTFLSVFFFLYAYIYIEVVEIAPQIAPSRGAANANGVIFGHYLLWGYYYT